jgi:hypothetical protein
VASAGSKLFLEEETGVGVAGFNEFLTSPALRLINAPGKRRSRLREFMILDLLFVATVIAFFIVSALYVRFCDRL